MENNSVAPYEQTLKNSLSSMAAIVSQEEALKELGFAKFIIGNNSTLQKCDINSLGSAVVNVVRMGLTLNPALKQAYLVPRSNKVCLDISYIGIVDVLRRGSVIDYLDAFIVYADEEFEQNINTPDQITHKINYPQTESEQKNRIKMGGYCRFVLPGNRVKFSPFIPNWEVQKILDFSTAKDTSFYPGKNWPEEMYKKTIIKRAAKMLLTSGEKLPDSVKVLLETEAATWNEVKPKAIAPVSKALAELTAQSTEPIQIEQPEPLQEAEVLSEVDTQTGEIFNTTNKKPNGK